ncbi:uncharacterized protein [Diabrotica undecimpunctata]|uniref:uncharacterized protein n=1 Tax=Diabrotica undecimpunctata TaxID=50387 RepID=UPI003B64256D
MVINPETAAAIVALLLHESSEQYVVQNYQISNSTVHHIFIRFLATGAYTRRPGIDPQRRSSARDDRSILLQSLLDRRATAVQISNQLQYVQNTNISERTVRRRVEEANLSSHRPAQAYNFSGGIEFRGFSLPETMLILL